MADVRRWPHMRRALAGLCTALLALALPVGTAAAQGGAEPKPRQLRVMTYNMHHGTGNDTCTQPPPPGGSGTPPAPDCGLNLERIAEVIRAEAPDLVGVQEVDRFWARSAGVDQPARLAELLGMHACFGANLEHPPDRHAATSHYYGTLILSRYPILECTNTHLPKADVRTEQRGLLAALIDVPVADPMGPGVGSGGHASIPIRFYNTHLQHCSYRGSQCTSAAGNPDRVLQVQKVVELIGTPREPVILLGDLNARPDWPELAPIYERFNDAWLLGGSGPGYTSPASPTRNPTRRIDYVFLSRDIQVTGASVPITPATRMAADHYPVVANLVLRASGVTIGRTPQPAPDPSDVAETAPDAAHDEAGDSGS